MEMMFKGVGSKGAWRIEDNKVVHCKRVGNKTFFIGELEDLVNDTDSSCISFSYKGKQINLYYENTEEVRKLAKEAYDYLVSNSSDNKMFVEFISDGATAPWVLTEDRIIIRKTLGQDREFLISEMIELDNHNTGKYPYIEFKYGNSSLPKQLYYKADEMVKAAEAVKYMKSVIQKKEETLKVQESIRQEELLNEKVAKYKKEKTKVYDEDLEKLQSKYYMYIKNYLYSLPKKGEYIVSGASLEDIRNSKDELKNFSDLKRVVEYLCTNRVLFKKVNSLGQTTYRLRESVEREIEFENQSLALAIYSAMNKKAEEYCRGCNDDKNIHNLVKDYSIAFNAYVRSVLSVPLQSRIPMDPHTAGVVGTVAGGLTYGALASIEANAQMEKYKENQNYYYQKKGDAYAAKEKVEYCFYKLQNALYEYGDVYDDWIQTKEEAIKSKL